MQGLAGTAGRNQAATRTDSDISVLLEVVTFSPSWMRSLPNIPGGTEVVYKQTHFEMKDITLRETFVYESEHSKQVKLTPKKLHQKKYMKNKYSIPPSAEASVAHRRAREGQGTGVKTMTWRWWHRSAGKSGSAGRHNTVADWQWGQSPLMRRQRGNGEAGG